MRNKLLLSIFTLMAVMMPRGAWATELPGKATAAFSLTTTGSLGTATGTANTYSKNGTTVFNKNGYKNTLSPGATESDAWTVTGTASYIKVELTNALKEGDVVTINAMGSGKFRICDDIANNSASGITRHGSEISTSSSMADCWVIIESGNALIGENVFYLGWSSGSNTGTIASIKVYQSDAPSTVSATKT